VGHYGGSYKVSYDLHKKYGDLRLLDTPICGALPRPTLAARTAWRPCLARSLTCAMRLLEEKTSSAGRCGASAGLGRP